MIFLLSVKFFLQKCGKSKNVELVSSSFTYSRHKRIKNLERCTLNKMGEWRLTKKKYIRFCEIGRMRCQLETKHMLPLCRQMGNCVEFSAKRKETKSGQTWYFNFTARHSNRLYKMNSLISGNMQSVAMHLFDFETESSRWFRFSAIDDNDPNVCNRHKAQWTGNSLYAAEWLN